MIYGPYEILRLQGECGGDGREGSSKAGRVEFWVRRGGLWVVGRARGGGGGPRGSSAPAPIEVV